jgi:outer membrane receptor protein involved in Fe transport
MSFHRPAGRTATLLGTLLMTTAFAVPALAQIETVTVTAEKRVEDIQTVPIAVTAYNAEDIAAHQLTQFKDLQFSTPNVTYTKGNFTGSNFQIRGIGITAVGYDAESGVAVHEDDVFLANPPLAEANFYDLEGVEVLRGPQSTLY